MNSEPSSTEPVPIPVSSPFASQALGSSASADELMSTASPESTSPLFRQSFSGPSVGYSTVSPSTSLSSSPTDAVSPPRSNTGAPLERHKCKPVSHHPATALAPEAASQSAFSARIIHSLILSYLVHNCYENTARALIEASPYCQNFSELKVDSPIRKNGAMCECEKRDLSEKRMDSFGEVGLMSKRRTLMQYVREGCILPALELSNELLNFGSQRTTLRSCHPELYADMLCQHFTELIRNEDNLSALMFARTTIAPLCREIDKGFSQLRQYVPLIAYKQPELSPHLDLLQNECRESLADRLNGSILATLCGRSGPFCHQSPLEYLLRQLCLVMSKLKRQSYSVSIVLKEASDFSG